MLHRLLAIAAEAGERPAIIDGDRQVSYAELVGAARAVADQMPSEAGPLVGIRTARGWQAIAAMIGVLMSGRAYVPVDPSYPEARQRYIEADARLSHVITGDGVVPAGDPSVPTHDIPPDAMYVIYTSGTTGEPKGVVVRHDNVVSLMEAAFAVLPLRSGARWSVFHSLSFDFSVWEIWGPLLSGGCAVLIDRDTALDPRQVLDLLSREQVHVLSVVPSGFSGLVSEAVRSACTLAELELVVFGGEAVRLGDVEQWWAAGVSPGCALVNMYGITETTVHVTECALTPELVQDLTPGRTPIGKPLPNAEIRISTDGGQTCAPDGEPGEMIVSGGGVAAGYLGRAELTASRFPIHNGSRSYRSGDWAVRSPVDGTLCYVGRVDAQVKIRGHRVELGEIEGTLARHPDVAAAACFVHRERDRPDRLFACVVGRNHPPDVHEVRSWLAGQLPAYAVPARVFAIDALPTTASGKVDRDALVPHLTGN